MSIFRTSNLWVDLEDTTSAEVIAVGSKFSVCFRTSKGPVITEPQTEKALCEGILAESFVAKERTY